MLSKTKLNYTLIIITTIFLIISLITIYSANLLSTINNIMLKQIIWILLGIISIRIIILIGNKYIIKNIFVIYILMNLLLIYLLLFGRSINNAKCWIEIPGIGTFQPSEFVKIALIIIIAKIVSKTKIKCFKDELKLIFKIFIITFIPSILTFLEPDTGAVFMYLVIAGFILLSSNINYKWFLFSGVILIISIIAIVYLYKYNTNLFIKLLGSSFFLRVERIINWTNSEGMQLTNGITAIGSGGFTGNGFANNVIYFPEAHTDFIFAIFSSNFGFLGSFLLILLITIFDLEIIKIANTCKNKVNSYIAYGILGIIFYQQIQDIGMTIGLLPITGITLPFISYGGSSLLSYMIMLGLLLNIYNENKKYKN